ncbi:unnamed protein product, partial [Allacma fusca]
MSTSILDVKQIKQEPQPSQDSIDNPGIPLLGSAKLHPKIETDFIVTKCDTDIKKVTAVKPLSIFSSCSVISSNHSSLDQNISQSVKEESKQAQVFAEYQKQQPLQHELVGNRSYHVLNVPLLPPPPPPTSPLISTDRKFVVKAEQDPITTSDHSILTHHRFHHNFLPIEEENNHLNLLATVAQEFGNEIGLIKPHRAFPQTFDTYEFKEEPLDKIDPFGHQHLLSSEESKLKSTAPSSVVIPSALPPAPPSSPPPPPPVVAPIVLRIPQIKPLTTPEKEKTKLKKPKSSKKKK